MVWALFDFKIGINRNIERKMNYYSLGKDYLGFNKVSAKKASNRGDYKKVCSYIKAYKKAFGVIHSHKLVGELKQKYPRRPAFLDELGKIK
jgi:hypothetical protein